VETFASESTLGTVIYACGQSGIWKSTSSGDSWQFLAHSPAPGQFAAVGPSSTANVYAGAENTTIRALGTAAGHANTYGTAVCSIQAAPPAFSPNPGLYATPQSVTISDATGGATIYYTTNGSTPTSSSAKYRAPIPVTENTTIKALVTAPGYTRVTIDVASTVKAGTYPAVVTASGGGYTHDAQILVAAH
jgi:hypothetical protein